MYTHPLLQGPYIGWCYRSKNTISDSQVFKHVGMTLPKLIIIQSRPGERLGRRQLSISVSISISPDGPQILLL